MVYHGAELITMEHALDRIEARAQEREWRSKPMDVLYILDARVKESSMVVMKNSKNKMDVAKEENGERLIK